jgi:hypothetical protein
MSEAPRNERERSEARRRARIDLLPTDLYGDETAAFDVVVDGMGLIGRWSQKEGVGGVVVWTSGGTFETGSCNLDRDEIVAAIRGTIPYRIAKEEQPATRRFLDRLRPGGGRD